LWADSRSEHSPDAQDAFVNSAMTLGGVAVRSVWAGIRAGARAAEKARQHTLARSAPAETSLTPPTEDDSVVGLESGSHEEDADLGSISSSESLDGPISLSAEWIKIIDVFPKGAGASGPVVVAHFRLPVATNSPLPATSPGYVSTTSSVQPVSHLSFSPDATQIFVAPLSGRAFYVFDLHVALLTSEASGRHASGEAWQLYELRRGATVAHVTSVTWSSDGRCIAVGTGKGTIRQFSRSMRLDG
jgi:hypothetical protein